MLKLLFLTLSLAVGAFTQAGTKPPAGPYAQCGGISWTGATVCQTGWTCVVENPWFSQCLQPSTSSGTSSSTTASTTTVTAVPTTTSTITITTTSTSISKTTTIPPSTTSSTPSITLTGIAATAPTTPPSTLTGKLPALGWNSWNAYGGNINETIILAAANQLVALGLKDVGYEYVNIDDCWAEMARDPSTGRLAADPNKFPSGLGALTAQIHALGLKIGIYSDAGTNTCSGYPGSLGYEEIDAATFDDWGIDYLKYDNCNIPSNWTDGPVQGSDWYNSNSAIRYRQMTAALAAVSRPIQYSLSIWGDANVWDWGARVGHSWRISGDLSATWEYINSIIATNVAHLSAVDFFAHNDMDMMEMGNGVLTIQEERTHFSAWCFLKSPILLGTDLSLLNSDQLAIIKNAELLAFHQDATFGTPALPFTAYSTMPITSPPEYYSGQSSKGIHVFIINTSATSAVKKFAFANVPGLSDLSPSGSFKVHDMWTGTDLDYTFTINITSAIDVAAHDTIAYLITPTPAEPSYPS